eukprot:GHVU01091778.1.p1 GENE.GHVU01091778.1~~GHVU01091778.1.p1  ORF type:complete len:102 (+),score=4.27 GHVU01091778.1:25-330(+)
MPLFSKLQRSFTLHSLIHSFIRSIMRSFTTKSNREVEARLRMDVDSCIHTYIPYIRATTVFSNSSFVVVSELLLFLLPQSRSLFPSSSLMLPGAYSLKLLR